MIAYSFALTCPSCAGPLEHRDSLTLDPDHSQAEAWCAGCLALWRLDVTATLLQRTRCGDGIAERRARAADAASGGTWGP